MNNYIIDTKLGRIKGKVVTNYLGDKYYSFQGIPYAKAPVGNLRFKAPQPGESWSGELDATKEGPACPSIHLMYMWYTGREDNCLNLNIYIKEMPTSNILLKPVMVWIHGGAFKYGSNSTETYGPDYLMTENVIQVFINYRLGILGFLSLEDDTLEVTGNAGLKDQVMALQWVKENISSFGGDPNNVTIYGISAGGASVHYLMLSSIAKGLFHKAIIQSGCVFNPWACGQRGVENVKRLLNITEDNEMKILEILQRITPKQLVNAQWKSEENVLPAQQRLFGPVVEKPSRDAFLSEDPSHILKFGTYNKVPMIIGATSNEGLIFEAWKLLENMNSPFNCAMEIPYELGVIPNTEAEEAIVMKMRTFYGLEEDFNIHNVYKLKSDNLILHGIHRSLTYHLESNDNPIYYYKFSFEGTLNHTKKISTTNFPTTYFVCYYLANLSNVGFIRNFLIKMGDGVGFRKVEGCAHGDEIAYMFACVLSKQMETDSREEKAMKRMVKLWTNFAKYGHPTPENEVDELGIYWKPAKKHQRYVLDISDELAMELNPDHDRFKFWDDIYEEYL